MNILTGYSSGNFETSMISNKSIKSDFDNVINNEINNEVNYDITTTDSEYDDYAESFKYNGREYLYSKLKFIQSQDYTYFILDEDKKEISITRISNAKGEVTIPNKLDGYKVVCLGVSLDSFSAYEEGLYKPKSKYSIFEQEDMNKVTSLIIPEGIKHIGITAFADMANLEEVSFPESLETIGIEAFANDGIKELVLPKNLELIDLCAFYGCESLAKVTVNSGNIIGGGEYPSFKFCENLELVIWGNVKQANVDLFDLSTIKKVVIPSSAETCEMTCCNIEKAFLL
jgi:hypothetical protein